MRDPSNPLFLERQSYRRRRTIDAARLLPAIGLFAFFIPVLWTRGAPDVILTSSGGRFVFVCWALLIVGSLVLSRLLIRNAALEEEGNRSDSGTDPSR